MDLRSLLLEEHSKERAIYICEGIIDGQASTSDLLDLLYHGDIWMRQRSSWPLEFIAKRKEELIHPQLPNIFEVLKSSDEDAVTRNLYRALQHMRFTEDTIGEAYDIALSHLSDPNNAVAIRVFAMTVCTNIATQFADLAHELIPIIESQYAHSTAGYKARANKELKRLNKLINTDQV